MIEVTNLTKSFKINEKEEGFKGSIRSLFNRQWKEKHALLNASMKISSGEVVGLIGANGAGKTTLIKLLTGIIHPTSGTASVLGFTPWERHDEYRRQIGLLMGQKAQLWWDLPALDCFTLLKEIYQVPTAAYKTRLDELAETLAVQKLLKTPVRRLSLGERMKMELIAVLLHRPRVLFLDEPTLGLDISAQRAIRGFLKRYAKEDQPAMLITSHYMEDIEELCERILIIREGQFVYDGPLARVREQFSTHKTIVAQLRSEMSDAMMATLKSGHPDWSVVTDELSAKIRVPRAEVTDAISATLKALDVQDVSIGEEDIQNIIEAIMLKKADMHGVPHGQ